MLFLQSLGQLDTHALALEKRIGKPVFLVGGCVRDILLGLTTNPEDIDLTLAGDPKDIYQNTDKAGFSHFMTEKYGTITLIDKRDGANTNYEITPFRTESSYGDKRHPDVVNRTDSLLLDAGRRDFTINAIYYRANSDVPAKTLTTKLLTTKDTERLEKKWRMMIDQDLLILQDQDLINRFFAQGQWQAEERQQRAAGKSLTTIPSRVLIDPYCGITDMMQGGIHAVGDPDQRFAEDALRIIRALRFVSVLNPKLEKAALTPIRFDIRKTTRHALSKLYYLVRSVAKERLTAEIMKVLEAGSLFSFVSLLDETNILKTIFPGIAALKNLHQPVKYHPFDVYAHTMLVLRHGEQLSTDPRVRLGLLYHDVGKVEQYHMHHVIKTPEEIRQLHGSRVNHVIAGVDLAMEDLSVYAFPKSNLATVWRYIANHMKPGEIEHSSHEKRAKKLRILLSEVGYEQLQNLLLIAEADRRGQYNPIQGLQLKGVEAMRTIVDDLQNSEGQFTKSQLAVNGSILMEQLKLPAGPQLGELLDHLFGRVMDDIATRNNPDTIIKQARNRLEQKK